MCGLLGFFCWFCFFPLKCYLKSTSLAGKLSYCTQQHCTHAPFKESDLVGNLNIRAVTADVFIEP